MKATKTLLAASILAAAGAANATVWDVTMDASNYFAGVNGNLVFAGFTGTYDDQTGAGSWSGHAYSEASPQTTTAGVVALDMTFNQTFSMPTTTGISAGGYPDQGTLNPFDVPTCYDNLSHTYGSGACVGFSGPLSGPLFNTVAPNGVDTTGLDAPLAFTPTDGAPMNWTMQFYLPVGKLSVFTPVPMNVTLHTQSTPAVPVPAAAWLFGSGLLGLAGTARRRRSAA